MGYSREQNLYSVLGIDNVRSGIIERIAEAIDKPISWFYREGAQPVNPTPDTNTIVQSSQDNTLSEHIINLFADKTLRDFQTYSRLYGIDKRHLYAQKMDYGRGYFEIYWLMPMIENYGISAEWLLFGKGMMSK